MTPSSSPPHEGEKEWGSSLRVEGLNQMRILGTKKIYLEQSGYFLALKLEILSRARAGLLAWAFGVLALLLFFITISLFDREALAFRALGAAEIFLAIFLSFLVYWLFTGYIQRGRRLDLADIKKAMEHEAYGSALSFFSCQIIASAADDEDLLLKKFFEFLLGQERFIWVLRRLNINPNEFRKMIAERYPPAASWPISEVLRVAFQKAVAGNHVKVLYPDLLAAVYELDTNFQRLLFDSSVQEQDLLEVAFWQRRRELARHMRSRFWEREYLLDTKGIGKDWSGGYTINLDKVARDLTYEAKVLHVPSHLFGRSNEIELLSQMLLRGFGGNVVLVGPPGVGRHTLLRAFAAGVNSGQVPASLRYLRMLELDTASILSGTVSLNEVVDKIQLLLGEAYLAENVILVIDDLDALFDPESEAGRVNAAEALLPFLQSRLRIIGTTTLQGYQNTIGKNPQLARLIGKLEVGELSAAQTLLILEDACIPIERQSGLFFSHAALKEIVKLTTKLIQNLPNPEKSLEILEEAAVFVSNKTSERIILPSHVRSVMTIRTKIPVEKVAGEEKDVLLNLESILHERIVNQNEGLAELSNALRRARAGVRSEKKPIGTFLFLGPTGVGKTETTKALAAIYFGSEQKIIRFDMSEFQEVHSINRLIGDADDRSGGILTEAVMTNPFSLILLDEVEKTHSKILDLFLQVFDEGRLTDALGRTVDFTNTMIIATSNAGAEQIREMVSAGRNPAQEKVALLDGLQRAGTFRPEFLNRFDAVVVFRPLSEEELAQIAVLLLNELNQRLAEKEIQINITPELAAAAAKGGYSPEFGARPLRRFIQESIENHIARGLLSGEIQRGQVVEIPPQMLTPLHLLLDKGEKEG